MIVWLMRFFENRYDRKRREAYESIQKLLNTMKERENHVEIENKIIEVFRKFEAKLNTHLNLHHGVHDTAPVEPSVAELENMFNKKFEVTGDGK